MREILFRGKRVDNGEWVYGDLVNHRCGNKSISENPARYGYGATEGYATLVIPSTVGQFTGLTDKNGKRIFEGDILDCLTCDYDGSDKWVCGCRITDITDFQLMGSLDGCHEIEVVGNIFDNAELIGGEQNG